MKKCYMEYIEKNRIEKKWGSENGLLQNLSEAAEYLEEKDKNEDKDVFFREIIMYGKKLVCI